MTEHVAAEKITVGMAPPQDVKHMAAVRDFQTARYFNARERQRLHRLLAQSPLLRCLSPAAAAVFGVSSSGKSAGADAGAAAQHSSSASASGVQQGTTAVKSLPAIRLGKYIALSGSSWWNLYFLLIMLLTTSAVLQFNPVANVLLLCFLLLPLGSLQLHRLRQLTAASGSLLLLYTEFDRSPDGAWAELQHLTQDFSLANIPEYLYAAVVMSLLFMALRRMPVFSLISVLIVLLLCLLPPGSWTI